MFSNISDGKLGNKILPFKHCFFSKKKYSQSVLKKTPFKSRKSVRNLSLRLTGFCFVSGQLKSDNFVYGSCELGEHQFMRAWAELRLLTVHMVSYNQFDSSHLMSCVQNHDIIAS